MSTNPRTREFFPRMQVRGRRRCLRAVFRQVERVRFPYRPALVCGNTAPAVEQSLAPGRGMTAELLMFDECVEELWPLRYVGVYCDRCGHSERADIRADSKTEAIEGLRTLLRSGKGWRCDESGDHCPNCIGAVSHG